LSNFGSPPAEPEDFLWINAVDSDGATPLDKAAREGHKDVVELLRQQYQRLIKGD